MDLIRPVTVGGLRLSNNLLMAALAGYSQRGLRVLARGYGASLAHTEMLSAYEVVRPGKKTRRLLQIVADDRPLGLQIFGRDGRLLAEAAARASEMGCFDLVDVNLACPVRKVIRRGDGGGRLKDVDGTLRILEAVRGSCRLPLTIKVRRGFDDSAESRGRVAEILRGAESLGVDGATIHGRTVEQIYHGHADWGFIYEMAAALRMPVFGSGDLLSAEAIVERLRGGPVAGVSVARGAVGHPWIFREVLALADGRVAESVTAAERVACLRRHFEMLQDEVGEYAAIRIMRRMGIFYSKRLAHARDSRVAFTKMVKPEDFEETLRRFFAG